MKRTLRLAGACLAGGMLVAGLMHGLCPPTRAASTKAPRIPAETDLLLNPDFERATSGTPDHWEKYGGTLTQVSAPVHGGSHAARFESDTSSTKWIYQVVSSTEGVAYVFSAWAVKNTAHIEEVYLRVSWYASADGSGAQVSYDDSTERLTTDAPAYRFLTTGPITAPAGAHSARARLMLNPAGSAPCAAIYDDASFRPVGAPVPAADLIAAKTGPSTADPGAPIAYHIAISNAGSVDATTALLTDSLPATVRFITQTSPFPFTRLERDLVWQLGDVPPTALYTITVTGQVTGTAAGILTNRITATTTTSETSTVNNADEWTTVVVPPVRLYALAPTNYWESGEAAALTNLGSSPVALSGWCLDDAPSSSSRVCFPSGAQIAPGQILWLAQDGDGFHPVWGFDAHWSAQAITRPVPILDGSWPVGLFADTGDAAYLLDAGGNVVDALAYGTGSATHRWTGPALPYPYAGYGSGQVMYRKLDQTTGSPLRIGPASSTDWAQDPDDPIDGRKVRYPGWDLEALFFPAEITTTSTVTLAVAPEGTLDVVSQTIASARSRLRIEAYTLKSAALCHVISDRIRAGVAVTILLESNPADGMEDVEKWIARQLHHPPTSTVIFIGESAPRYRFQHAKFILVDERTALVSTDNFGEHSMPSDPKVNGTMGHRGFVAVTDSPGIVARLAKLFNRDCDLRHHQDTALYEDTDAPPEDFAPLPPPDWTTYTARFTAPLVTTATHITVLHAPEHSLRDRDSLLGLLNRAGGGDRIAAMQMNEPLAWSAEDGEVGLNPRLQALVAAARRDAEVRVLLDAHYRSKNIETCLTLNQTAAQEGLNLTCRLADPTGLGIHAKVFLVSVGDERWVHLGSINGTETSNKNNREAALQVHSARAYDHMLAVFNADYAVSHAPMVHRIHLPLVTRDHVAPAKHPLVTEILVNPNGDDAGKEWIEIYNPGPERDISGWSVGDALSAGDYGDGRYTFPAGTQFLHRQVIVVAACATNFAATYGYNPDYECADCESTVPNLAPETSWEGFGLAMGNAGDEVVLLDRNGVTLPPALGKPGEVMVDSVVWGGEPRADVTPYPLAPTESLQAGTSLKRYPPDSDRDDCARDFYVSYSPSPGMVAGD